MVQTWQHQRSPQGVSDSAGGGRGFGVSSPPPTGYPKRVKADTVFLFLSFQRLNALLRGWPVGLGKPQLNLSDVVIVIRNSCQTTLKSFALDAFIGWQEKSVQAMKECWVLQAEMLATLQSFRATVEKWQEAPSTRESSPSQDGTSASYTGRSQGLTPYFDEEEAEASDQNSCEGEDSDLDSQPETRPRGHLFAAKDMEGLLKAIYTSEGIQMPAI